jgi:ASPIC and UnbV
MQRRIADNPNYGNARGLNHRPLPLRGKALHLLFKDYLTSATGVAENKFSVAGCRFMSDSTNNRSRTDNLQTRRNRSIFHLQNQYIPDLYLSASDLRLYFGLGGERKIKRLEIQWPSGRKQTLTDVATDQLLSLDEEDSPQKSQKGQNTQKIDNVRK